MSNSKFEKYEILKPFLQRHIVERVLKTNPPVFVAIDSFACTRGMNTYGLSQEERLLKEKKRVQFVRNRSIEGIKSAWEQTPPEMQKQILLCWQIDWSRELETTDKFHCNPAAVIEIVPKDDLTGTSTLETEAVIELNDPFSEEDDDGELAATLMFCFESFPELLERQNPTSSWWGDYTIPLESYKEFDILDDFPLRLVVRSSVITEYTQLPHKVKRAFRAAMETLQPYERSAVYAVFSTCWRPDRWGKQDASPSARIVLLPEDEESYGWVWMPGPRVIEVTEGIVVSEPEHALVKSFEMMLFECIVYAKHNEKPVPWLTGKALRLAQALKAQ